MDFLTYICFSDPIDENCPASHFEVPSHNLLSIEAFSKASNIFEDNESDCSPKLSPNFPVYQPFPYAVQNSVLFCGSCPTDHASELVERKLIWETELEELKVSNTDAVVKDIRKIRQNKAVKLSKDLKKYIKHFHRDPEPMFSGEYNWLYTGGSLCYDKISDEAYLITSDSTDGKPSLNIMQLNESQDEVLEKSSYQLKAFSPVLQITCKPHTESSIICVRQKNYLSLIKINRMSPLSAPLKILRKKVSGSKLLTCVDLETNCENFIVTDSNHDINLFNIERKNKIYGYPGRKIASHFTENTWSQVEFGDLGIYWALRNRFVIFDLRDFNFGMKLNFEFPSEMDPCENICSFTKSQSDANFVYLSTTHRVLQLDLRSRKIVQKWSHLLERPPQFMATVKDKENIEVLLLQSPSVDEILGITNENVIKDGKVYFLSKSLPYLLNNIKDSVSLARSRNACMSFLIPDKVDFAVTGMQCLKNIQGDMNLFITNSGGDVFLTKIRAKDSETQKEEEDEQKIIKGLEIYESALEKFRFKQSLKKLENFKITNMSQPLQDFQHSEIATQEKEKREIYWKYQERDMSKIFDLFQDISTSGFLDIWFPPDLKVEEMDTETEMVNLETKVLEWLATL